MQSEMSNSPLRDSHGRIARYLRLSLTDRCNLACFYCRGAEEPAFIPHSRILRYEEMLRFVKIARASGILKVRITGGEPFARKDCMGFLASLRLNFPDLRICLTTNGTLLEPYIEDLRKLELESVNVSIDSFQGDSYARITRQPMLATVLKNVDRMLSLGQCVKINAVALKGVTDVQIDDFIHAVKNMPVDIRFIEFMPMGAQTLWSGQHFLSCGEILQLARTRVAMAPSSASAPAASILSGPAQMYDIEGARGRFGFISALSNHFCASCNRLRLTSDGNLRLCLFSDKNYRLAPLLRNQHISDSAIAKALAMAHRRKPVGTFLLRNGGRIGGRNMSAIGG